MTDTSQATVERPFVDERSDEAESLVLDIGDDVGALVLYTSEELLGSEISVSSTDVSPPCHTHTMIRRRRAPNREVVAGVYPELPAGAYTIWGEDGAAIAQVVVRGGKVTEFDAS